MVSANTVHSNVLHASDLPTPVFHAQPANTSLKPNATTLAPSP